jgi:tetratricopeptide (TPR) repeat protein
MAIVCVAGAQTRQLAELQIEIVGVEGVLSRYSAELESLPYRETFAAAAVSPDGFQRFRDVPYGQYALKVKEAGRVVYEQTIEVGSRTAPISIRVPPMNAPAVPAGPISIRQLAHPVDGKARRAFLASEKYFDAGDYKRAAAELHKALALSPDYAEAHATLGAVDLRTGEFQAAADELGRAIEIAGPSARDLGALGLAQFMLKRYDDAAKSARSALRLDADSIAGHYVLGAVLALDARTASEAVPHLEIAARSLPSAAAMLAVVRKSLER